MKISKKSGIISLILVAAIALASFGFANWTTTLTADGSVSADATWLVQWKDCVVSSSDTSVAYTAPSTMIGTTNTTNDTLHLGDVVFSAPGAWIEFTCTIENAGTIDAELSNANIALGGINDKNILATIGSPICEKLAAKGTCEFTIVLQLDPNFKDETLKVDTQNLTLTITEYTPDVEVGTAPTAVHSK